MTDVKIIFSVPVGVTVLQAPSKIPPIFNGEKLVLYGILKGGDGVSGQCSATLKAKLLGSDTEYCMNFEVSGPPSSSLSIVHQLAVKSLIKELESNMSANPEKKEDIIRMSVECSVVSSFIAYVAIDEHQDKLSC